MFSNLAVLVCWMGNSAWKMKQMQHATRRQTVEIQTEALYPGQGPEVGTVQRCGSGFLKTLCIQELIKPVVVGKCVTVLEGQYKRKAGFLMESP